MSLVVDHPRRKLGIVLPPRKPRGVAQRLVERFSNELTLVFAGATFYLEPSGLFIPLAVYSDS
jgi:hypothetical protein